MMEEAWRVIEFEPEYSVSSHGRIMRNDTGNIKSLRLDRHGYQRVTLYPSGKTYSIHRLVALTYLKSSFRVELQIDHIDGNKSNNHLSNLEWVTSKENVRRSYELELAKGQPCDSNSMASISNETAKLIKYSFNLSNADAAKKFKTTESVVEKIRHRKRWVDIVDENLEESFLNGKLKYARSKGANITADVLEALEREISLGELSPVEIAKKLGIGKTTVYRRIKKLRGLNDQNHH